MTLLYNMQDTIIIIHLRWTEWNMHAISLQLDLNCKLLLHNTGRSLHTRSPLLQNSNTWIIILLLTMFLTVTSLFYTPYQECEVAVRVEQLLIIIYCKLQCVSEFILNKNTTTSNRNIILYISGLDHTISYQGTNTFMNTSIASDSRGIMHDQI